MNSFLGGIPQSEGRKKASVNQDPLLRDVRHPDNSPPERSIARGLHPAGPPSDGLDPNLLRIVGRPATFAGSLNPPWRPSTATHNADKRRANHSGNLKADSVQTLPQVKNQINPGENPVAKANSATSTSNPTDCSKPIE